VKRRDAAPTLAGWGVPRVRYPPRGDEIWNFGEVNTSWAGPQENPMNAAEGSSCNADFAGVGGFCRSSDKLIDELAAGGDDWKSVEKAKP